MAARHPTANAEYVKLSLSDERALIRAVVTLKVRDDLNATDHSVLDSIIHRFVEEGSNVTRKQLDNVALMVAARPEMPDLGIEFDGTFDNKYGSWVTARRKRLMDDEIVRLEQANSEPEIEQEPERIPAELAEVFDLGDAKVVYIHRLTVNVGK